MEQINKCRTEPKAYCARLEKRLGRFAEGSKVYKFKETSIVTMEGVCLAGPLLDSPAECVLVGVPCAVRKVGCSPPPGVR